MNINWSHKLSLSVVTHINELLCSCELANSEDAAVARLTSALPVYSGQKKVSAEKECHAGIGRSWNYGR
jgi:hypothetical protein